MYKSILKRYKKEIMSSFLMFGAVVAILWIIKPAVWYDFALLITVTILTITLLKELMQKKQLDPKQYLQSGVKIFVFSTILYFLLAFSAWAGIWGFIGLIVLLAVWKMWNAREFIGYSMAQIETTITGKPLTKKWRKKLGYEDDVQSDSKK